MSFSAQQLQALKNVVARCVEDSISIVWENEPERANFMVPDTIPGIPPMGPAKGAARVRMRMVSTASLGFPVKKQEVDTVEDLVRNVHYSQRLVTVQFDMESVNREYSYSTMERIRTRITFQENMDELRLQNVSFATYGGVQNVVRNWDNREISTAILEMRFNVTITDAEAWTPYIRTVNTTNDIPYVPPTT